MTPRRKKQFIDITKWVGLIVGILAIVSAVGGVAARGVRGLADIDTNREGIKINRESIRDSVTFTRDAIGGHEARIDSIQDVVTATHTDVEWIRERMEREHP